ncbi:MAG: hypothetical protein ACRD99_00020 [Nitrososphaera sp.]
MAASPNRSIRLLLIAAVTISLIFPLLNLISRPAFADGIFREEFNASLKGREARLSVVVNPPILTSETRQDAFVQFRLFDEKTNDTIKFSTFAITIEKGAGDDADRLLRDVFHTESGLLTLKMQPREGEVTILGTQEQFANAWVADPGGTVNIRGPIFLEGGLYHFGIDILGIDSIRSLFPPAEIKTFDSWLSVGDVFSESVQYNGNNYNTTIISYYDRVQEFDFNEGNKTFTWSMPFEWNASRIAQTTIFVHEEVKISKAMEGIGNSVSFKASVNDQPLRGARIIVDPYTSETELVLHYLLSKADILSLAEKVPAEAELMSFSLTPSSEVVEETTTEISTDTGGINVYLEWTPDPLNANAESTVKTTFSDAFSGKMLEAVDVMYDLRILDMNGTVVHSKQGLTANNGTDTQTIDFPSNENYRVEIQVQGLVQDGGSVDNTRNGIARGLVVVPEFPVGAAVVIGVVLASIVLVQRYENTRGLFKGLNQ